MKSNYRNKQKGYKYFVTPAVSEVRFCIFFPLENISVPLVAKMYFGILVKKKINHWNGADFLPNEVQLERQSIL